MQAYPNITVDDFGTLEDGQLVKRYTMEAESGFKVELISYGAALTAIYTPDRNGHLNDVVLGHDHLEGFLQENDYYGGTIGRFCNRIANGQFELEGKHYELVRNNGAHHLHGGNCGFDTQLWEGKPVKKENAAGVEFHYISPDMEEGYPGNLSVYVTYWLLSEHTIEIEYKATTDKTTVLNLTNHAYFNFNPHHQTILSHELQIEASEFLPVTPGLIPMGAPISVKGTPFDFRKAKPIGQDIDEQHEQLLFTNGYDHSYVFEEKGLKKVATVTEPECGRQMEVFTTEPAMQFYSGNFLDGSVIGKEQTKHVQRAGFCLETQHFPDSPNHPEYPSVILSPGQQFHSRTQYKFSVV